MAKANYTTLVADVEIKGIECSVKYHIEGQRVKDRGGLEGVPEYLKELTQQTMTGIEDKDHKAAQAEIEKLSKKVGDLSDALENAEKQIAELKTRK